MGVEFNLFSGDEQDLQAIWPDQDPLETLSGIYAKGADVSSIGSLYSVISGRACNDDDFQVVRTIDDNQLLVARVPKPVQSALETINESNVKEILAKWSRTDGFKFTGWDTGTATDFLLKLGEHVRANPRKSLFIWICC